MIPCVVITHGQLANELVSAAEMIVGEINNIVPLCIGWQDDVNAAREEIEMMLNRLDTQNGVILMTDMLGGTPSNLAMSFLKNPRVQVVTSTNLPMIIQATRQTGDETVIELARTLCERGRNYITNATQTLLEPTAESDKAVCDKCGNPIQRT